MRNENREDSKTGGIPKHRNHLKGFAPREEMYGDLQTWWLREGHGCLDRAQLKPFNAIRYGPGSETPALAGG